MNPGAIERCLDLVVEKAGDPSELVYQRLYQAAPNLKSLFELDPGGKVRGEMFQQVIEAILDLSGESRYAANQIASEWTNHQGLGVPGEQFRLIFVAVIETFQDILGSAWSPEFQSSGSEVLAKVDTIIAEAVAVQARGVTHVH